MHSIAAAAGIRDESQDGRGMPPIPRLRVHPIMDLRTGNRSGIALPTALARDSGMTGSASCSRR